jgi:hypothetical protein
MTDAERRATAYFEAGCAAMAHASSIQLRPAVIEPKRRRWVYEKHWPAWADPYSMEFKMRTGRNWLETRVGIFFAGCVAEHRYLGRSVDDERAADCEQVVHALVGFGGSERANDAWLQWLHLEAEDLLEDTFLWTLTESIANDLIQRGQLTRANMQEAVRRELDKYAPLVLGEADLRTAGLEREQMAGVVLITHKREP